MSMNKPKTAKDIQKNWLEKIERILQSNYMVSKDISSETRMIIISDYKKVAEEILRALRLKE